MSIPEELRRAVGKKTVFTVKYKGVANTGMLVSIGVVDAVMPLNDVELERPLPIKAYLGKTFEVRVVRIVEGTHGEHLVVSRKKILEERWAELAPKLEIGASVSATVEVQMEFGWFVRLESGLLALMPKGEVNSKISPRSRKPLTLHILAVNIEKKQITVTPRHVTTLSSMSQRVGSVLEGKVESLKDFGAFVSIGKGLTGLIPASELSWSGQVVHPADVLQQGQRVKAHLYKVDGEKKRITLSLKRLTPDPWSEPGQEKVGDFVNAVVLRKSHPGYADIRLESGKEGILHVSDLDWSFPLAERSFKQLGIGSTIQVKVLECDQQRRRLCVGAKQLKRPISESPDWKKIAVGTELSGNVVEVFEGYAIVEITPEVFGRLAFVRPSVANSGDALRTGQYIAAPVIAKDAERGLILMSKEHAAVSSRETEQLVKNYRGQRREVRPLDTWLTSIEELRITVLWNYLTPEEQEEIQRSFEEYPELFSPGFKAAVALYITFDPLSGYGWDGFVREAIAVLGFEPSQAAEPGIEKKILNRIGEETFWYAQYDDREGVTKFNLFCELVAFYGEVKADGRHEIRSVKFRTAASENEKKRALRREAFYLDIPVKILGRLDRVEDAEALKKTSKLLRTKIRAMNAVKKAQVAAGRKLLIEGREFRTFHEFLAFQLNAVRSEERRTVLAESFERAGTEAAVLIRCRCAEEPPFEVDEFVSMHEDAEQSRPFARAIVRKVQGMAMDLEVQGTLEAVWLERPCVLRSFVSTSQFRVQMRAIEDFLLGENESPLLAALHHPDHLEIPDEPTLKFFNALLANAEAGNNQPDAVNKGVGNRNIFLIQGPPGTGKTTVIREIVQQLLRKGERLLVTGQTHISVDNVLEHLKDLPSISMLRIGINPSPAYRELSATFGVERQSALFAQKVTLLMQCKRAVIQALNRSHPRREAVDLDEIIKHHVVGGGDGTVDDRMHRAFRSELDSFTQTVSPLSVEQRERLLALLEEWQGFSMTKDVGMPLLFRSCDVVFGTCIGIGTNLAFNRHAEDLDFDTVIVDEAGKANISETLTAIQRAKKVVLVGDHKQLPPYVDREWLNQFLREQGATEEKRNAIFRSLFEKLQEGVLGDTHKVMLNRQYRMHPTIGEFVSQTFYNGGVANGPGTRSHVCPVEGLQGELILFDTSNDAHPYESGGQSKSNRLEATIIAEQILPPLLQSGIGAANIAIIAPYSAQVQLIRERVAEKFAEFAEKVEIATLDSFQGREVEVMVFSFTRSHRQKKVGFLDDMRRLNVAFSRPRSKLVLVGNTSTLTDPRSHEDESYTLLFRRLVDHVHAHGQVVRLGTVHQRPRGVASGRRGDINSGIER